MADPNPQAADPAMAPVFEGWNVWAVYQKTDLDFEPLMLGLSRDRRLRIWVEDNVRLNAPGTDVADPIDVKGSQVQIIAGDAPSGLKSAARKEQVPGDVMLLEGDNERRVVRFFNHGKASALPWPHDSNYLLDEVYQPDPHAAVSSGDAPRQIAGGTADDIKKTLPLAGTVVAVLVGGVVLVGGGVLLVQALSARAARRLAA